MACVGVAVVIVVRRMLGGKGDLRPIHAIIVKIIFSYAMLTTAAFRAASELNLPWFVPLGDLIMRYVRGASPEEAPQQHLLSVDCLFSVLHKKYFDCANTERCFETHDR